MKRTISGAAVGGLTLAALAAVQLPAHAAGTVTLTSGSTYTQDFDTLASSGTANTTLPEGWWIAEAGTSATNNGAYAAGTGSSNSGDTYSFGASGAAERALGGLQSGSLQPTVGVSFTNGTDATITGLRVAYTGEQWRYGSTSRAAGDTVDRLDLQVSSDATSLTTGSWTDASQLDFTAPAAPATAGALDGNAAANRTAVSGEVSGLAVAPGATVWLRWSDYNVSSSDDGLGVDDVSVTPVTGVVTPPDTAECGDDATPIHDVQGDGASTPLAGTEVEVEGVVVGDHQASTGLGGFYLQEEDADVDADPATSEGIFVFGGGTDVAEGDVVRLSGTPKEYVTSSGGRTSSLTELTSVSDVQVCSSGASVTPAGLALPADAATRESVEGMSVVLPGRLTVTEVYTLARFGEVSLAAGGRLMQPTNVAEPGAEAAAVQAANDARRILLDDASGVQNPATVPYPQGGLSAANTLRVGDSTDDLAGVLDERFGAHRVQPGDPAAVTFEQTNPRPAAPEEVGGDVRVASFNVLNYFNGQPEGDFDDPANRGAEDAAELERQTAKVVAALTALDADVVGLMEIENDPTDGTSAQERLVEALNAATAPGTYDLVDTGVVGTDAIRVGLLYQPARVTPVGEHAVLDSSVDPRFVDTKNRPSIAQTFARTGAEVGDRVTVVVNHLKSKGSDCDDLGDPDTGDGQGNCNQTRTAAAEALVDWIATDPTGSGDPDTLVIGDLNSYAQEDPIDAIKAGGFVDTLAEEIGEGAYSYVFEGQSGYLDHALASEGLAVTGATEWHVNADEPVALDYNTNFKSPAQVESFYAPDAYRSSDHDPVLVGLDLDSPPTVDAGGPYTVKQNRSVTLEATGSDPDGDALSYAWDLDGDGTFETEGRVVELDTKALRWKKGTYTVSVQVTAGGVGVTDTAAVTVGKP